MKKNKGVLTIEAALMIPMFVFSILFMSQFMKLVYIYDTVQTNVYNTAKFINGYSYIANGMTKDIQCVVQDLQEIFTDASGIEDIPPEVTEFLESVIQGGVNSITKSSVTKISKLFLEEELKKVAGTNYSKTLGIKSEFDFSCDVVPGKTELIVKYDVKVSVPFFKFKTDSIPLTNRVMIKNLAS